MKFTTRLETICLVFMAFGFLLLPACEQKPIAKFDLSGKWDKADRTLVLFEDAVIPGYKDMAGDCLEHDKFAVNKETGEIVLKRYNEALAAVDSFRLKVKEARYYEYRKAALKHAEVVLDDLKDTKAAVDIMVEPQNSCEAHKEFKELWAEHISRMRVEIKKLESLIGRGRKR